MAILSLGERSIKSYVKGDVVSSFTGDTLSFTVETGQGSRFPAVPFALVLYDLEFADPSDAYWQGKAETILCTGRVADVLTVVRGIEGTTPFSSVVGHRYRLLHDATSGYLENVPRFYNLRAYGAKIDGVTDDTQAWEDALSDMPVTGGTIFVPRGSGQMIISQGQLVFTGKNNIAIIGEHGSRIKGAAGCTASQKLFDFLGTAEVPLTDILIRGLEIDGNSLESSITTGTQAHLFTFESYCSRVVIENCYLHHSPGDFVYTGTNVFATATVFDVAIRNNVMETCLRNGISMVSGERLWVQSNKIDGFNTVGIDVEPDDGNIVREVLISGNWVRPAPTQLNTHNSNRLYAISCRQPTPPPVDAASQVRIEQNHIKGLSDSGVQYPAFAIRVDKFLHVVITGNECFECRTGIDGGTGDNITPGSTGLITANHVHHCIHATGALGIQARSGWTITGNTSQYNGGPGIRCSSKNNIVVGNHASHNGRQSTIDASTGPSCGIWIEGDDNVVVGNVCTDTHIVTAISLAKTGTLVTVTHTAHGFPDQSVIRIDSLVDPTYETGPHTITVVDVNTYTYTVAVEPTNATTTGTAGLLWQHTGIYIRNSASGNLISNNDVRFNLTQGIRIPSTYNTIRENLGYLTESTGSGTILSGSSSVIVPHNCDRTPRAQEIMITPTATTATDPGHIWVDTIGATSFTVRCKNAQTSAGMAFAWSVVARP